MSYQFAGFFANPIVTKPNNLSDDAIWRIIGTPFQGMGILLPSLMGKSPSIFEVRELASELGLNGAADWLYLAYDCWGGEIDYVYGLGICDNKSFGLFEESTTSRVTGVYLGMMEAFGISEENALMFAPFERGYWVRPKFTLLSSFSVTDYEEAILCCEIICTCMDAWVRIKTIVILL